MKTNNFYMGLETNEVYERYGVVKCGYPDRKNFYVWKVFDDNNRFCAELDDIDDLHNYFDDNDKQLEFPINGKCEHIEGYMVACLFDNDSYTKELNKFQQFGSAVTDIFIDDLKEEYCPDELLHLFDIMYSEAYDRGHSAGYNEVVSHFSGIVEFTQRIIEQDMICQNQA